MARRLTVRLSDEDEKNLRLIMAVYGQKRADSAIRLCLSLLARAEAFTVKPGLPINGAPTDWC